jgi:PAS domain S-box-containing protein
VAKDSDARESTLSPQTEIILNSIAEGVFTVDPEWRITFFNRAAEKITGVSASEAIGRPCCEVFRATGHYQFASKFENAA